MINSQRILQTAKCHQNSSFCILQNRAENAALPHSDKFLQYMCNSAKYRMMNSDDILQFAKFVENLTFLINSASCKNKVELYILIRF